METYVRQLGNSAAALLPAPFLKSLGLEVGSAITIQQEGQKLVIQPADTKPKYTLDELLAKCDLSAPALNELADWEAMPPAGEEI